MKKLEIFGDSILKGVMYSEEQKKYKLCQDSKFSELTQYGIEVKNNSKMGATITDGLNIMSRRIDSIDKDTIVLLSYGGNDCDFMWNEISNNPNGKFFAKTPENEFIEKYETAVNYAKSKGAEVVIASLIPIDADKYMNWISRNLNYDNILSWLGDVSMLYRWQEHYNYVVENIASKLNCKQIDLRSGFLLNHNYSGLLCADGIHPTQYGHSIIKSTLSQFMQTA